MSLIENLTKNLSPEKREKIDLREVTREINGKTVVEIVEAVDKASGEVLARYPASLLNKAKGA